MNDSHLKTNKATIGKTIVLCLGFVLLACGVSNAQRETLARNLTRNPLHKTPPAKKRVVSVHFYNEPLPKALHVIADKADAGLSFKTNDVPVKPVTYQAKNKPVYKVLDAVLKGTGLHYMLSDNRKVILIKKRPFLSMAVKQQQTISGVVTDAQTDDPLPGVNILVVGTSTGTATDANGHYSLQVESLQDTLRFSFIGYQTKTVPIDGRVKVDVQLASSVIQGQQLVVTALGQTSEKSSLSYSTQQIQSQDIEKSPPINVANTLSGRISGISVNESSTGIGGNSRITLRGNRSISGSSQPLYVVDGVPISGDINGLNPNDIESINVLKGANAAALYGSEAANGVIIVTTKKGRAGETQVSVSENFTARSANIQKEYQNIYGQGDHGKYVANVERSWGPKMEGQKVDFWSLDPNAKIKEYPYLPQPSNVKDAFQKGFNSATNFSVSTGTQKTQYYFSAEHVSARGIIPNNKLFRNDIDLRITSNITDKLELDAKLNYIRRKIDNPLPTGGIFTNPTRQIYKLPRNIRLSDARNFEYTNADGILRQNFWNPGSNGGANPFWVENRETSNSLDTRSLLFASLSYDLTDNLNLLIRSSLDQKNGSTESKLHNNTYINAPFGRFSKNKSNSFRWGSSLILNYKNTISEVWSLDILAGGEWRVNRNESLGANTGSQLIIPNFFALSNTQLNGVSEGIGSPSDLASIYGSAKLGFKDAVYLNFSGRNDWSSTLPEKNWSYFYPSGGLNVLLSRLFSFPDWFSLAKVRANYAIVGNGAAPFMLSRSVNLISGGNSGFLSLSGTLPAKNLRPEKTNSLEIGANMGFINNKIGLAFTWYKENSKDQLFTIGLPVGSGASSFYTNGGNVQNKGVEATLRATPISSPKFKWNIKLNFSRNRNIVKELNAERSILTLPATTHRTYMGEFRLQVGKPWGLIYSRGFVRDDQGRVIVDSDGLPELTSGTSVPVANYNPNWLGGIESSFSYKNFNFSFLVNIREGGTLASFTDAILYSMGSLKPTLKGRGGKGVIFGKSVFPNETAVKEDGSPNDISVNPEDFWRSLGGRNNPVGEAFVMSVTNVLLRNLSIGYTIPGSSIGLPIRNIQLILVGRNLFFFYNAADANPNTISGSSKSSPGYKSFTLPPIRSYGINLKFNF
jgi:TonB-linked SusC/RagA family outer membrane protein